MQTFGKIAYFAFNTLNWKYLIKKSENKGFCCFITDAQEALFDAARKLLFDAFLDVFAREALVLGKSLSQLLVTPGD